MKKLSLLAVILAVLSVMSCKKERTCECTSTSSSGDLSTTTVKFNKIKKSEAKTICQKKTYTYMGSGAPNETEVMDCELK